MSEEVAEAIGTIDYWRRRAEQAERDVSRLSDSCQAWIESDAHYRQAHAAAWVLLGRAEQACVEITTAPGIGSARRIARAMATEIAQAGRQGGGKLPVRAKTPEAELAAARRVVDQARRVVTVPCAEYSALRAALRAWDAVREERDDAAMDAIRRKPSE